MAEEQNHTVPRYTGLKWQYTHTKSLTDLKSPTTDTKPISSSERSLIIS